VKISHVSSLAINAPERPHPCQSIDYNEHFGSPLEQSHQSHSSESRADAKRVSSALSGEQRYETVEEE
jgi:hypothetical protein